MDLSEPDPYASLQYELPWLCSRSRCKEQLPAPVDVSAAAWNNRPGRGRCLNVSLSDLAKCDVAFNRRLVSEHWPSEQQRNFKTWANGATSNLGTLTPPRCGESSSACDRRGQMWHPNLLDGTMDTEPSENTVRFFFQSEWFLKTNSWQTVAWNLTFNMWPMNQISWTYHLGGGFPRWDQWGQRRACEAKALVTKWWASMVGWITATTVCNGKCPHSLMVQPQVDFLGWDGCDFNGLCYFFKGRALRRWRNFCSSSKKTTRRRRDLSVSCTWFNDVQCAVNFARFLLLW